MQKAEWDEAGIGGVGTRGGCILNENSAGTTPSLAAAYLGGRVAGFATQEVDESFGGVWVCDVEDFAVDGEDEAHWRRRR